MVRAGSGLQLGFSIGTRQTCGRRAGARPFLRPRVHAHARRQHLLHALGTACNTSHSVGGCTYNSSRYTNTSTLGDASYPSAEMCGLESTYAGANNTKKFACANVRCRQQPRENSVCEERTIIVAGGGAGVAEQALQLRHVQRIAVCRIYLRRERRACTASPIPVSRSGKCLQSPGHFHSAIMPQKLMSAPLCSSKLAAEQHKTVPNLYTRLLWPVAAKSIGLAVLVPRPLLRSTSGLAWPSRPHEATDCPPHGSCQPSARRLRLHLPPLQGALPSSKQPVPTPSASWMCWFLRRSNSNRFSCAPLTPMSPAL